MREIRALIWKEWCETRIFLWIAWGLFIGLPIIGGIEVRAQGSRYFKFYTAPWVMTIGPLLAIVIGVAASCRDFKPKLEDFWQSRPMGGVRLFIVKYFVCIIVVLLACGVPLLLELWANEESSQATLGLWLIFLTVAVFSTAFASGCVFHKTAHAAALAIAGTLLIYCLPIVFPPLSRFDLTGVLNQIGQQFSWPFRPVDYPLFPFAGGMVALAIVMCAVALAAVRFHWHIESGKPLVLGSFGAGFLVLIASASCQFGTNLPVLQQIDMPAGEIAFDAELGDGSATLYIMRPGPHGSSHYFTRTLSISNNSLALGPPTSGRPFAELPSNLRSAIERRRWLTDRPFQEFGPPRGLLSADDSVVRLSSMPGVPASERLKWVLGSTGSGPFDGETWCQYDVVPKQTYEFDFQLLRLKSLSEDRAEFRIVSQYKQTLIQRLANGRQIVPVQLQNGLLYAAGWRDVLDVFDVSGNSPPKLMAHFAASNLFTFAPLPDGRVLAAGSKIWLLGAPKH